MRTGRPTTLTPKLIEQFVNLLEDGALFEMACGILCVPERTFYEWRQKGAKEIEARMAGEEANERMQIYVDLAQAVTRARDTAHNGALKRIISAGKDGNVSADMWFLERTAPQKFGRQTRVNAEVEVKGDTKLVFNLPKPAGLTDLGEESDE